MRFCLADEAAESAKRMKFSSLTRDELREAYRNTSESLDWGMVHAGLARAYMEGPKWRALPGQGSRKDPVRQLKDKSENGEGYFKSIPPMLRLAA
ncbi:hypothetical protein AKJ64_04900 [candidate division MSBL1 archaeon SCGC-AAA259E17]|uniref:Uncharacterized protein n=1 Tax=candidate division MSBL1 archaeon SCGC-AAA259E17 TaxID=1698263 RepID=A0A133UAF9_9EURY|nr:hypothetical protein AKJ64_04900 [candidate division MSBL1 archaeon SCGC-AAA259E17]